MQLALATLDLLNIDPGTAHNLVIGAGSSRGATGLFEHYLEQAAEDKLSPLASPTTTLGNLSSWLAYHLRSQGMVSEHSVTCSSGLYSLFNGIAWLRADMCSHYLACGTEAPLTGFTLAQMQALGIYSKGNDIWPSRPFASDYGQSGMMLGEGAVSCLVEKDAAQALARISGIGHAHELIPSKTGITSNGEAVQKAIKQALYEAGLVTADVVIAHGPGTSAGDRAEWNGIQEAAHATPYLTTNKHIIGHTLGASGLFSVEYAIALLHGMKPLQLPYITFTNQGKAPEQVNHVLVTSTGFGGNAFAVVLSKP